MSDTTMLFSERLAISKEVDEWFEQNPPAVNCTLNMVTALTLLGYKISKIEPITLNQAQQVLAEAGMVTMPLELTQVMAEAGDLASEIEGGCIEISAELYPIYDAMVKAAQQKPDA
jgi:hypothetical protein